MDSVTRHYATGCVAFLSALILFAAFSCSVVTMLAAAVTWAWNTTLVARFGAPYLLFGKALVVMLVACVAAFFVGFVLTLYARRCGAGKR
jgi:hypothetical protein